MKERITTAGIVKKDDKFLVGKRSVGETSYGLWEFIGGKKRDNESEIETLKREFLEEISVDIEVVKYLATHDFINKDILYHLKAYLVELKCDDFKPFVHSEFAYLTLNEIKKLKIMPSDLAIVEKLNALGL